MSRCALMLAARAGKPLPPIERTKPLGQAATRKLAGHYEAGDKSASTCPSATAGCGCSPRKGGFRLELRKHRATHLIVDDRWATARRSKLQGRHAACSARDRLRARSKCPGQPRRRPEVARPDRRVRLGPQHSFIFEKDGKLHALIEWFFLYPLDGSQSRRLPVPRLRPVPRRKAGLHARRNGRATERECGQRRLRAPPARRRGRPRRSSISRIRRSRNCAGEALAATPPKEKGAFRRKPDLVDLTTLDTTIKLDIRYARHEQLPEHAALHLRAGRSCRSRPPRRWCACTRSCAKQGYGLLIHDAYRPWYVTKMFWDATPPRAAASSSPTRPGFAAQPRLRRRSDAVRPARPASRSRWSAATTRCRIAPTPTTWAARRRQRWHRDLLRRAMEDEGFTVYEAEWWHFDYKDWPHYRIGNVRFENLGGKTTVRPPSE